MEFRYCEEKISFEDFFIFLQAVEEDFVPPLLDRIDINAYYNKINEYATMVECYCQEELVGLIISYDNDVDSCRGYTTFCAVKGGYRGNNIAGKLLERACTHAKTQGMRVIGLHTYNEIAKRCYMKNGFTIKESIFIKEYNLTKYYLERKL